MSTNGSVHWVSSAVRNPQATTVILSQVPGQSVRWKVEVQGPVYWKEQPENHSSSEAVVLFCRRLSS